MLFDGLGFVGVYFCTGHIIVVPVLIFIVLILSHYFVVLVAFALLPLLVAILFYTVLLLLCTWISDPASVLIVLPFNICLYTFTGIL